MQDHTINNVASKDLGSTIDEQTRAGYTDFKVTVASPPVGEPAGENVNYDVTCEGDE
jgi:hypothetical protein